LILSGKLLADMKELPPRKAKTWQTVQLHAFKYSPDNGLLYQGMIIGNQQLCVPALLADEILYDTHNV
jgi:hypothetical protein